MGGVGLQRQSDAAKAYAEQRGWDLHPETYSDEGVSGFTGANLEGDLGRFLKDLKEGKFGTQQVALGIEDIDRLSRQFSLDFLPLLVDQLLNAGVTLAVISKGRDISRASIKVNAMEIHELLFWLGGAHEFSAKLSARITDQRERIREAIRQGKPVNPGRAPTWISLVDGQWQLNPYADVVRRIIGMAQEGMGAVAIARQLNSEKVLTPLQASGRKPPPPRVKKKTKDLPDYEGKGTRGWDKASVLQLLKQPAIRGARAIAAAGHSAAVSEWKAECARLLKCQETGVGLPPKPARQLEEVEGYYPALISPEEHQALLLAMSRRRSTNATGRTDQCNWIAQRLTTCACCGSVMTATQNKARVSGGFRVYRHIRCSGRRDQRTNCTAPMVRFESAQAALLTRLSQGNLATALGLDQGSTAQKELATATTARASALKAVSEVEARLAVGEQAINESADPSVLGILAKRQSAIAAELAQARTALAAADLEIDRLQRRGDGEEGLGEVTATVSALLMKFHAGEDEPADRQAIQSQLKRIGLQVQLNGETGEMGLAIGEGPVAWEPMTGAAGALRELALKRGYIDPSVHPEAGLVVAWEQGEGYGLDDLEP